MDTAHDCRGSSRPGTVGRRELLGLAGTSALSLKMGLLNFASSLFAGETAAARKPPSKSSSWGRRKTATG